MVSMNTCKCGCGQQANRNYVSGHNLRNLVRTKAHADAIAASQKRAWATKRARYPVGSKKLNYQGYMTVKVSNGRWRMGHTLAMENHIGRKLNTKEVVHHIDGNRANNDLTNLFLCRSRSHHNDVHRSQDRAFRKLLTSGLAMFKGGEYQAVLQ